MYVCHARPCGKGSRTAMAKGATTTADGTVIGRVRVQAPGTGEMLMTCDGPAFPRCKQVVLDRAATYISQRLLGYGDTRRHVT